MTPFRQKRVLLQRAEEWLLDPRKRIHDPELSLFLCDAVQKANDSQKMPMPDSVVKDLRQELKSALRAYTGSILTSGTVGNVLRSTTLTSAAIEEYELAYHTRLGLIKTYSASGFNVASAIEYAIASIKATTQTKWKLSETLHSKAV